MLRFLFLAVYLTLSSFAFAQGPGIPMKSAVRVGTVIERDNVDAKRYTGQVVSAAVVRIVPRVSGEIIEVGFSDGKPVKKGQLLYRIDPVQYEAAAKNAEAKIAECKAKLEYSNTSYDRNKKLRSSDAVSQDAMENIASVLHAAQAALLAAEADLIVAKDNLKNCTINAPIDGAASVTKFTAGNYITPNSGELVNIRQVNPMRVRFAVSNMDFRSIFANLKVLSEEGHVRIAFADGVIYEKEGTVELIDNEANSRTDSLIVYASFDNSSFELFSGSTVSVTLSRKNQKKRPAILPSALMHDSGGAYVYVVSADNKIEKRSVELGNPDNEYQLILSGLKVGERVVIGGTNKTAPGAEIIPYKQKSDDGGKE